MAIAQRRSLSSVINDYSFNGMKSNTVKASIVGSTTSMLIQQFGAITVGFNNQFRNIMTDLSVQRQELDNLVRNNLAVNPDYHGARTQGVELAWRYERADILMGGTGSADWSYEQRQEILNGRKTPSGNIAYTVRGAEGHHQKNVADHPEHQANPDNIKFYTNKQEHLQQGHDGNFQNESDAEFIDKDHMLHRTNQKRVITNELRGMGMATVIGFGIGFTISAIVELAKIGIDSVEMGEVFLNSVKSGTESGVVAAAGYGIGRLVQTGLESIGVNLFEQSGYLLNYATTGFLTIALFSTYQLVKLKMQGVETSIALKQVGKQTLFSLSILTVSIIAQGVYGGHAGLIVSTSVGLVFLAKNIVCVRHQRIFEEKLREYTIEQYRPLLRKDAKYVTV